MSKIPQQGQAWPPGPSIFSALCSHHPLPSTAPHPTGHQQAANSCSKLRSQEAASLGQRSPGDTFFLPQSGSLPPRYGLEGMVLEAPPRGREVRHREGGFPLYNSRGHIHASFRMNSTPGTPDCWRQGVDMNSGQFCRLLSRGFGLLG